MRSQWGFLPGMFTNSASWPKQVRGARRDILVSVSWKQARSAWKRSKRTQKTINNDNVLSHARTQSPWLNTQWQLSAPPQNGQTIQHLNWRCFALDSWSSSLSSGGSVHIRCKLPHLGGGKIKWTSKSCLSDNPASTSPELRKKRFLRRCSEKHSRRHEASLTVFEWLRPSSTCVKLHLEICSWHRQRAQDGLPKMAATLLPRTYFCLLCSWDLLGCAHWWRALVFLVLIRSPNDPKKRGGPWACHPALSSRRCPSSCFGVRFCEVGRHWCLASRPFKLVPLSGVMSSPHCSPSVCSLYVLSLLCVCVCVCVFSLSLSIYIYISIYLSIYLSISLSPLSLVFRHWGNRPLRVWDPIVFSWSWSCCSTRTSSTACYLHQGLRHVCVLFCVWPFVLTVSCLLVLGGAVFFFLSCTLAFHRFTGQKA